MPARKHKNRPKRNQNRRKNKGNGKGGGNHVPGVPSALAKQLEGLNLDSLLSMQRPDPALRGPSDEERKFRKLTPEEIDFFIANGELKDEVDEPSIPQPEAEDKDDKAEASEQASVSQDTKDDEKESKVEKNTVEEIEDEVEDDADLLCALQPMPEPRPLEDVYALGGLAGGDDQKGGSDKTLLAKMLDPDAGGKGNNRDGLAGLVSPERLSDPKARLRQRLQQLRRRRGKMTEEDIVRDARGRKVRGARAMSMEDMQSGNTPQGQRMQVDRNLTAQRRKAVLEKLKSEAQRRPITTPDLDLTLGSGTDSSSPSSTSVQTSSLSPATQ